jgi:hypothetical protein
MADPAGRVETWVCRRLLAGNAGSNSAGCMDICLLRVLCCQGIGLCDLPITRPEELYECGVSLCDLETSTKRHLRPEYGCWATRKRKGGGVKIPISPMTAEVNNA